MSHERWLAFAVPVLVGACRVYTNAPSGTSSLTAADNLAANAPVAAQSERLSRCPSAVNGATTVVSEIPAGVEVRVMGTGDATTSEIRKRATSLAASAEETRGKHQSNGAMNGQFGRCPIVMRNTKLEVREIPGGAAVAIKPANPSELDWLRREVEARSAQISNPKLFGPGLMRTCPSAVPNAATTIIDTPNGVDVKIIESSPAGTRAIRERAKELASQAPARDERCPTSATDVTVSSSEVTGGVIVTLKPKRSEDLEALRRTVHERARTFAPPASR
jgi:hypothetical protein